MKFNFLVILFLFFSCLDEKKIVICFDFEKPTAELTTATRMKGDAFSGDYFVRTNPSAPLGFSYSKKLSEVTPERIKQIDVALWIREQVHSDSSFLYVSLFRGDTELVSRTMLTMSAVPLANEWTRLYVDFELQDVDFPYTRIEARFVNSDTQEIDIDDFRIRFFQ